MSTGNQGTWLERQLVTICRGYRRAGTIDLEKVEPPTKVVKRPPKFIPEIIRLANPFLDFVGTWTRRGGRAVFIEAKSTAEPRLGIRQSGGISETQHDALERWHNGGAAVGIIWAHRDVMRFVPIVAIRAQIQAGVKHIKWDNATPIPQGMAWVLWDFERVMGDYYPQG